VLHEGTSYGVRTTTSRNALRRSYLHNNLLAASLLSPSTLLMLHTASSTDFEQYPFAITAIERLEAKAVKSILGQATPIGRKATARGGG
jgi:hypothetical protein